MLLVLLGSQVLMKDKTNNSGTKEKMGVLKLKEWSKLMCCVASF